MRISRFYLPDTALIKGQTLSLNKVQAHYALTVLRLKDQRPVEIFDGKGTQAQATLQVTSRRTANIFINQIETPVTESPLNTVLLQAISKGDRMDTTIQKTVELGIREIQPLFTQHCDIKLSDDKLTKRVQQWQDIAINACEQSGRNVVPKVLMPQNYQAWVEQHHNQSLKGLVLDPYAKASLSEWIQSSSADEAPVHLLVGPEGGLAEAEVEQAKQLGFDAVRLGPRILRTETAGMTILSILQSQWGDF